MSPDLDESVSPAARVARSPMERPRAEASEPGLAALVNSEKALSEHETESSQLAAELAGPIKFQLDRLGTQVHGLQEQLAMLIARRNEAVAERASRHVAAIVAAAEESAAQIRASAEKEAATIRERLLADVETDVDRIRAEAQADAERIRGEGHIKAARARERAITEASEHVQAVCARLSTQLQAVAREAIAGIARGMRAEPPSSKLSSSRMPASGGTPAAAEGPANPAPEFLPQPVRGFPAAGRARQITYELDDAVDELKKAAAALERSLQNLHVIGGEQHRTHPA